MLDVGCGTGSHALCFAQHGCEIIGTDLDADAVETARQKCNGQFDGQLTFHHNDVNALSERDFDLAVSMFNVVNYIDSAEALAAFFTGIAQRLRGGGAYIFDCWNGVAAMIDPPCVKHHRVKTEQQTIEVNTWPSIDLINQTVNVTNHVEVVEADGTKTQFNYDYVSVLWTPRQLREALIAAGFEVVRISRWMEPDYDADEQSWKIMFICRKPASAASAKTQSIEAAA